MEIEFDKNAVAASL